MSLDLKLLEQVKDHSGKVTARCPACAEIGHDSDGNHLVVYETGAYACIKCQSDAEHSHRIFELAGAESASQAPLNQPQPLPFSEAGIPPWEHLCAALAGNKEVMARVAAWRGWPETYVRMLAETGYMGLYEGRVCFPVRQFDGSVTGIHIFTWPGSSGTRAWYCNGNALPLVVGAVTLDGVEEVAVLESQWDAFSVLCALGWHGELREIPFVVTRGAKVHARCAEWFAGIKRVTLWPQRDAPQKDGAVPSEEWAVNVISCLSREVEQIQRVDTPEGHKDWNDVLKAQGMTNASTLATTAIAAAKNVDLPSPPLTVSDILAENMSDTVIEDPLENAFPLGVLPRRVGDVIQAVADATLVPVPLVACAALGAVSAALGPGLELGNRHRTRGNLFVMGIAPSGTGKGQAFNLIMEPLLKLEEEAIAQWKKDVLPGALATKQMLEEAKKVVLRKSKGPDAEWSARLEKLKEIETRLALLERELVAPTWVTADCTQAKLEMLLSASTNETMASLSPEARNVAAVLAGKFNKGQSGEESVYLSAYSGETLKVHRASRPPVQLTRPCLTVTWMVQPDVAMKLLADANMTESGLLPRMLVCNTPCEPQHQPEEWMNVPPHISSSWHSFIREIAGAFHDRTAPLCIEVSPAAERVIRDYHNRVVDRRRGGGDLCDLNSYAARWHEQAWRIAVVLHTALHGALAGEKPLTADLAEASVEIVEWFGKQQLALLAESRRQRQLERLERLTGILRSSPAQQAQVRVLQRSHGFEAAELVTLANSFPQILNVVKERTGKPGQPPIIVKLSAPAGRGAPRTQMLSKAG